MEKIEVISNGKDGKSFKFLMKEASEQKKKFHNSKTEELNYKQCPSCKSILTVTKDIGYLCEVRECEKCKTRYTVKFKQVATRIENIQLRRVD